MSNAFRQCTLKDKKITLGCNVNEQELRAVINQFTSDLLDANIPNCRPVGFIYPADNRVKNNVVRTSEIFEMTYVDFGLKLNDIIPYDIGGNNIDTGCFYGMYEDVEGNTSTNNLYGKLSSNGKYKANILNVNRADMGALLFATEMPYRTEQDKADGIRYSTGDGPVYPSDFCDYQEKKITLGTYQDMLIQDKLLFFYNSEKNVTNRDLVVFIKKGTGRLSYYDTQKLFADDIHNFMPCQTNYDLSKYISCDQRITESNTINLIYDGTINENVLEHILREYGGTF